MSNYKYLLLFLLVAVVNSQTIKCPTTGSFRPCSCTPDPSALGTILACRSVNGIPSFTNAKALMEETRKVNTDRPIYLYKFMLRDTPIVDLDLTIFKDFKFNFGGFNIYEHKAINLRAPSDLQQCRFQAAKLSVNSANMNDVNVIELLKCVDPSSVQILDVGINNLEGNTPELWTRIASLTELSALLLNDNKLATLGGGQFKPFKKLILLQLQNNEIATLENDAFEFEGPWNPIVENIPLTINIDDNAVTADSIGFQNALPITSRLTTLTLRNNLLETIPERKFRLFLNANLGSIIELNGNEIICDSRARWLQDARDVLEMRVLNARCSNDDLYTVFTSKLVNPTITTTVDPEDPSTSTDNGNSTTPSSAPAVRATAVLTTSFILFYYTRFVHM